MSKPGYRPRKSDRGVSDFDALLNAIKSIKISNVSIRQAAATNEIPYRSLARYKLKFDEVVEDIHDQSDEQLLNVLRDIASYKNVAKAQMVCDLYFVCSFKL